MKLRHVSIITIALGITSCATIETTVTAPDGTTTKTKTTTLSGSDIATGATGIGSAVKDVTDDK
jgi:hypothetical protein